MIHTPVRVRDHFGGGIFLLFCTIFADYVLQQKEKNLYKSY